MDRFLKDTVYQTHSKDTDNLYYPISLEEIEFEFLSHKESFMFDYFTKELYETFKE